MSAIGVQAACHKTIGVPPNNPISCHNKEYDHGESPKQQASGSIEDIRSGEEDDRASRNVPAHAPSPSNTLLRPGVSDSQHGQSAWYSSSRSIGLRYNRISLADHLRLLKTPNSCFDTEVQRSGEKNGLIDYGTDNIAGGSSTQGAGAPKFHAHESEIDDEILIDGYEEEDAPAETQKTLCAEDLQSFVEDGNPLAVAMQKSNEHLLQLIYSLETQANRAAMRGMDYEPFAKAGHVIIASMYTKVLKELIGGNLPLAIVNDTSLRDAMMQMKRRAVVDHPGCYVRFLVNTKGLSPTGNDLLKAIPWLRGYAKLKEGRDLSDEEVTYIETQVGTYNGNLARKHGGRRYLSKSIAEELYTWKDDRVAAIDTFTTALKAVLDELSDDELAKPFASPLKYVGYAVNMSHRNTTGHDRHSGSNFLMGLTESIMMLLHKKRYRMRWWPVLFLASPHHPPGAEIMITTLTGGYVETGTGFAHYSAGESNYTHERLNSKNEIKVGPEAWNGNYLWMKKNTPLIQNMEAQTQIILDREAEHRRLTSETATWISRTQEVSEAIGKTKAAQMAWLQARTAAAQAASIPMANAIGVLRNLTRRED